MATDWQIQGKTEKPRPLRETLALHHPGESVFIGKHTLSLWGSLNNEAVLLNDKTRITHATQGYRFNSVLSVFYQRVCMFRNEQNPEKFLLFQNWGEKIARKLFCSILLLRKLLK